MREGNEHAETFIALNTILREKNKVERRGNVKQCVERETVMQSEMEPDHI